MEKKVPTFEFVIDDSVESGVKAISIVADPAFQSEFITFGKSKPVFVELEKKKRICAGLSLIPDVPIYRFDEVLGEYYGYFSAETIEKIVEKYHMEMNQNKVNLDHNPDMFVDAFLIEDYIVDSDARVEDLKSKGIEHPNIKGAWYTAFKIKDEKVFNAILQNQEEGFGTGFSVEAFLDKVIVSMMKNENKKIEIQMKKEKKTLLEKIVSLFQDADVFERALVPELGFEIEWQEVGGPVQQVVVAEDGTETLQPLAPGEYATDMGVIVVDEAGLVEVREIPAEEAPVEEVEPMAEPEEEVVEVPVDEVPIDEIPVDEPVEEPVVEVPVDEVPVEEPVEEVPVEDPEVMVTTIGEVVGDKDGEYTIKVKVEGGLVVSAEVSSETDLLMAEITELKAQKQALEEKMEEPIEEPKLEPAYKTKDFKDMSAYEKVMYRRNLEK